MKKVLFIDRDGTMIKEPKDEQIDAFAKLEFYPGVFSYLSRIASEL
ncbi:MAG: bifunctional histidinol-phosphatase/imidazoleglycerol-phosphate dehydratase, partial [Flavobacteriaceae bacterium]|nr:bifunctional histidinol-phosphatase/imidazoleglycerol-phosphate dehydratase [Flavobacteriaceae bacterium]